MCSLARSRRVSVCSLARSRRVSVCSLLGARRVSVCSLPGSRRVSVCSLPGSRRVSVCSLPGCRRVSVCSLPGSRRSCVLEHVHVLPARIQAMLMQLGPRECLLIAGDNRAEAVKLRQVIERAGILVTERKKGPSVHPSPSPTPAVRPPPFQKSSQGLVFSCSPFR